MRNDHKFFDAFLKTFIKKNKPFLKAIGAHKPHRKNSDKTSINISPTESLQKSLQRHKKQKKVIVFN